MTGLNIIRPTDRTGLVKVCVCEGWGRERYVCVPFWTQTETAAPNEKQTLLEDRDVISSSRVLPGLGHNRSGNNGQT
jgi:hypothetical protein